MPVNFMVLTDGFSNLMHVITDKRIMRSAVICTVLIVECHIWSDALCGPETWSLGTADDE